MRVSPLLVVLLATFSLGQTTEAQRPQLVITPLTESSAFPSSDQGMVHDVQFTSDSTLRILATVSGQTGLWQLGDNQDTIIFPSNMLPHQTAVLTSKIVVATSPLQVERYDILRQSPLGALPVDGIDAWPLACHPSGLCVWQSGKSIRVVNVNDGKERFNLPIGDDAALSIDISPDAKILAVAVNEPNIRLWSLADGKEFPSLPMEATPDGSLLGAPPSLEGIVPRMFVFPRAGMATALKFSPDGRKLAAANETALHVWETARWERFALLKGYTGRVSALAFSADSRSLSSAAGDLVLRVWMPGAAASIVVGNITTLPRTLTLRGDNAFVAAGFPGGRVELWNVKERALSARIFLTPNGWIAATPSGLFDGNDTAWHLASWRFPGSNGAIIPVEAFYRQFYRPGLITDLLTERKLPEYDVGFLHLDAPKVAIQVIGTTPASASLAPTGIQFLPERIQFHIEASPNAPGGVVSDLAITVNGKVVQKWPGNQKLSKGIAIREADLEMPPDDARVTAYAFNADGVRSTEAVWERKVQGGYRLPQRTLHVLAIGIRNYNNPAYNLSFADNDAAALAHALGHSDTELEAMSDRLMNWWRSAGIQPTGHSSQLEVLPSTVKVKLLLNEHATREAILSSIRELAQSARPRDAIIIYYAGHGINYYPRPNTIEEAHYYLLPWDMGLKGRPNEVQSSAVREAAATLISDSDLQEALGPLNVDHGAIILDSCSSGQALEGAELHGPLNIQGLSGLAYEKGLNLLAASQSSDPSYELKQLGSGVLAYALVHEGLDQNKADSSPLDGRIELQEWLKYGASRVSSLAREQGSQQEARLSLSRIQEHAVLLLKVADKLP